MAVKNSNTAIENNKITIIQKNFFLMNRVHLESLSRLITLIFLSIKGIVAEYGISEYFLIGSGVLIIGEFDELSFMLKGFVFESANSILFE